MNINSLLTQEVKNVIENLYHQKIDKNTIQLQKTRPEFEGELTLVTFPLLKISKKNPQQTAQEIGDALLASSTNISNIQVVQGFLNLSIANDLWFKAFYEKSNNGLGILERTTEHYMVEFSSPNTNKPLHLGHLRNIFLGDAVSKILLANGHKVTKTQIINDRGIHICKSMIAWKKFGKNSTPLSSGMKGDHFVGHYYVAFDKALKEERETLLNAWKEGNFNGAPEKSITEFKRLVQAFEEKDGDEKAQKGIESKIKELVSNETTLMLETKQMLQDWEAQDSEVRALWEKMNGWVYDGFNATYARMNVEFDKLYYESDTYLTGKELVEEGLAKGICYKKEDGSVWVDLTGDGLDEKLVLRGDGTAVYMTQDIGTALQRMRDFEDLSGMVYVVGNEQDYHFTVLFLILQKLGFKWAKNCHHLSYGMIELPHGKMKSREGTVVDADDLMEKIVEIAKNGSEERGHIEDMSEVQKNELFDLIGLGGLKYYLLKVDPKKRMQFDPQESVDLQGNTAPFIQYTFARISAILRKAGKIEAVSASFELSSIEKDLIVQLLDQKEVLKEAGKEFSPALICNYIYELAKSFNGLYQNVDIFREADENKKNFRLALSKEISRTIEFSMHLLGINVPEKM